jgi:maltose alpha-D-glucosyltransferase/alpha-amylase
MISSGPYGFKTVNVAAQRVDDDSLLNWTSRAIRARSQLPEFGLGTWETLETDQPSVLALAFRTRDEVVFTFHNLSPRRRRVSLRRTDGAEGLESGVDVFADRRYEPPGDTIDVSGHGYRWLRSRVS